MELEAFETGQARDGEYTEYSDRAWVVGVAPARARFEAVVGLRKETGEGDSVEDPNWSALSASSDSVSRLKIPRRWKEVTAVCQSQLR